MLILPPIRTKITPIGMKFLKTTILFAALFSISVAATADNKHLPTEKNESLSATLDERESIAEGIDIVEMAKNYIGCRYVHGAAGPSKFDCSGFTSYIYNKVSMKIGRTPGGQYQLGQAVSREDLRAGDLVFFRPRSGNRVGHVGIVTEADGQGNFKFIHASIKGVKITNFEGTNYYTARYIGARRLL